MAIDRITQKILADADAESKRIAAEADAEIARQQELTTGTLSEIENDAAERAAVAARDQKDRMISRARAEMRKEILQAKQDLIQSAFDQAGDRVLKLDDARYGSLMKQLLLDSADTGEEEVILAERDAKRDWKSLLEEVNRALVDKGLKGKLILSTETRSMTGGFVLRQGKKERNCDVGLLLRSLREETETEIAGILFPRT